MSWTQPGLSHRLRPYKTSFSIRGVCRGDSNRFTFSNKRNEATRQAASFLLFVGG